MSAPQFVRKPAGEVEDSTGTRLDAETAAEIVDALNTDLAATYVLYHQLKKHHWQVDDAEFRDLHRFLAEAARNAESGADDLAERIHALGGVPHASAGTVAEHAPVEPEAEDVYDIATSLEHDHDLYGAVIENIEDHIEVAETLDDHPTQTLLEDHRNQLEADAGQISHYLEDDTVGPEETPR